MQLVSYKKKLNICFYNINNKKILSKLCLKF